MHSHPRKFFITQVYTQAGRVIKENYTYLFDAFVAKGGFEDFDWLIVAIPEEDHYFVVKSVNIDPLVALFVSFDIRNILKRVPANILGAIKGRLPHLELA